VTNSPVIEDLTALVDAVWVYSSRTLDTATPAASNGSYLDDIGHSVWTYTDRTAIDPSPPLAPEAYRWADAGPISGTLVRTFDGSTITDDRRKYLFNGGGIEREVVEHDPQVYEEQTSHRTADCHWTHEPRTTPISTYEGPHYPVITQLTPVPGTVLSNVWQQFNRNATTASIFEVKDHDSQTYVRSYNTLTGTHDVSCILAWQNLDSGANSEWRCVTAISPNHGLTASHFGFTPGNTLRFVAMDNRVVNTTVHSVVNLHDLNYPDGLVPTDIQLVRFTTPLPSWIVPALLPPADWWEYFAYQYRKRDWFYAPTSIDATEPNQATYPDFLAPTNTCPVLFRRQQNRIVSMQQRAIFNSSQPGPLNVYAWGQEWVNNSLSVPPFDTLSEPLVTGDSGGPCFVIVNGRLVLLGTAYRPEVGPSMRTFRDDIAAVMVDQYQTVDLSMFRKVSTVSYLPVEP
jgi:hypothetical protein